MLINFNYSVLKQNTGIMEKVLKEETFKYRNRSFNLRLLEKDDGFYVYMTDDETDKDSGMYTYCSHKVCNEIIAIGNRKNPIVEIVETQKAGIAMWVDKGLI